MNSGLSPSKPFGTAGRTPRLRGGMEKARTKPAADGRMGGPAVRTVSASQELVHKQTDRASLQRRLAEAEAELVVSKSKAAWLESALEEQRNARQILEASLCNSYGDTVSRIRNIVETVIPEGKKVLVVSKGDTELLQMKGRCGWHFPQTQEGEYAGFYPVDSAAAIKHLTSLMAKGAEFLLFPNTAFWWLEHYHALETWLQENHRLVWRDERCAIYRLALQAAGDANGASTRSQLGLAHVSGVAEHRTGRCVPGRQRRGSSAEAGCSVICFPIIDWGFRFQRPQHLMLRFANAKHPVFYLSHQFRKSGRPLRLHQLAKGVREVSLCGPRFEVDPDLMDARSVEILFEALTQLPTQGAFDSAITVVQSPFWWPLAQRAAVEFGWPVVYDCMDFHQGFPNSSPLAAAQESALLSQADLVIASSALLESNARRFNPNVMLVRNACEYEHFSKVKRRSPGSRPVIGYFGAIAQWFNSQIVAELARKRPDWDFVLIGSTLGGDVDRLLPLGNVKLTGEKAYRDLPEWLETFDVTILPFHQVPLTDAADPVKAYEIFAAGKPLVSVPLPELLPLAPLVKFASTAQDFERSIEAELNHRDPQRIHERKRFAKENTWQKRFEQLYPAIRRLFPVTIVPASPQKKRAQNERPGGHDLSSPRHPASHQLQNS